MNKITEIKDKLNELKTLIEEIDSSEKFREEKDQCHEELGDLPYKVIHLNKNPFNNCIVKEEAEYEELKRNNERLKARLSLIETGNNVDVTMRIDEAVNNAHQIEMLKQQVNDYKSREEKIVSSLRKTADDFRKACLSLIGYRVDALEDNIYRLTHRYAKSDEDRLFFEVKRDGTILLKKNAYSNHYSQYVSTYLEEADSYPAFLAAITLDMFRSQVMNSTQSVDMSMSMSTTVLHNPRYSVNK